MQTKGLQESKVIREHKILHPIAWIYGLYLYVAQVLTDKQGIREAIKGRKYMERTEKIRDALSLK